MLKKAKGLAVEVKSQQRYTQVPDRLAFCALATKSVTELEGKYQ